MCIKIFDRGDMAADAAWCNETQSATWQDMGDYYECVEVEPTTPPKEIQIAQLDAQYASDKAQLMQYYFEFSITEDKKERR